MSTLESLAQLVADLYSQIVALQNENAALKERLDEAPRA